MLYSSSLSSRKHGSMPYKDKLACVSLRIEDNIIEHLFLPSGVYSTQLYRLVSETHGAQQVEHLKTLCRKWKITAAEGQSALILSLG